MRKIKRLAYFGDAESGSETEEYKAALELARVLARKGYVTVNGGGPGVMEAATRGAAEVGGKSVGVTFYPEHAPGFEGRYLGNKVDVEIKTTNYVERMYCLMEQSDLFLIFKGGTGTVSEFGTAWVLAKLYFGHHKPFILVGGFWRPIVKALVDNLNIDESELSVFKIADEIGEVPGMIEEFDRLAVENDHEHEDTGGEGAFMD